MSNNNFDSIVSLLHVWPRPNMKEMERVIRKCITETSKKYGMRRSEIIDNLLSSKKFLAFLFGDFQSLPFDVVKYIALQDCGTLNVLLSVDERLRRDFNEHRNEYYRHLMKTRTTEKKIGDDIVVFRKFITVCGKLQSIDDNPAESMCHRFLNPVTARGGKITDRCMLTWYDQGIISRKEGPAVVDYHIVDGKKMMIFEEWYENGIKSRVITYGVDGNIDKDTSLSPDLIEYQTRRYVR